MSPPTTKLLMAQALASEARDAVRDLASAREIRDLWRSLGKPARLFWLRKAKRVLGRMQVLGPDGDGARGRSE